jgi:hypothetical protein
LFNSDSDPGTNLTLLDFSGDRLSAKNLLPLRHSMFIQGQYPVSPLVYAGMAVMYFPGENGGFFINPNMGFSLAENWDLDLIGQVYYAHLNERWQALVKYFYWRGEMEFLIWHILRRLPIPKIGQSCKSKIEDLRVCKHCCSHPFDEWP